MTHCRACHENRFEAFARAAKRVTRTSLIWERHRQALEEGADAIRAFSRALNALKKHVEAYEKDKAMREAKASG